MDSFFFENRDYFLKRIQQLEPTTNGHGPSETEEEPFRDTPETSVCVRIRPLTEHEREHNHVEGAWGHKLGVVNLYEPKKKFNGKPELNNHSFTLDEIYGPGKSTEDIYSSRVNELVQWGLEGGTSMLLAYGQTGSGKTYTVTGVERLLVDKLIEGQASGKKEVRVCIFEVSGSNMFDLLNERNPLTVKEDAFGAMQLGGVFEKNPRTSDEFLGLIDTAKSLRSTASTTKNDQSSRSHSICRIRIIDTKSEIADEGNITLVDLAGSEASSDTSQHSRERMAETREINKSLNVLKDCITKRAQWSLSKADAMQKW